MLWEEPEVVGTERAGYEIMLDEVAVEAGEMLRCEVSGPAGYLTDGVSWAPSVAYLP